MASNHDDSQSSLNTVQPAASIRPRLGRERAWFFWGACLSALLLLHCPRANLAAEAVSPQPALISLDATNSQQLIDAILQIESHLRSNQAMLNQNRKEAIEAATRNAELLSNGLQVIENAFSMQQAVFAARNLKEFEALHSSNRLMLILAGTFAGFATLAILIMAWFQWRMSKAWSAISAALPTSRGLGGASNFPALGSGDAAPPPTEAAEQSNLRLLGAIEQLDRRVQQMEASSNVTMKSEAAEPRTGTNGNGNGNTAGIPTVDNGRIAALLEQGQACLRQDDLVSALTCFDQVLLLEPKHGEALVKKGAVLERLQRLNEAFECYDRAIAADASMTIAYLHKGGLCNRLERFKEALECYEKALRTHTEWRV
jgi:tetratricopeptide (TPR) repeat protein